MKEYLCDRCGNDSGDCAEWYPQENHCELYKPKKIQSKQTPQERQRAAVYATGNKWAIENWNLTHN